MKIFLDDDPVRDSWVDDTWTIVRDPLMLSLELIVQGSEVEVLSLDHDLAYFGSGSKETTGYDVLKQIEEWAAEGKWCYVPQHFEIHSANPVGRKNMQAAIDSIERMRASD